MKRRKSGWRDEGDGRKAGAERGLRERKETAFSRGSSFQRKRKFGEVNGQESSLGRPCGCVCVCVPCSLSHLQGFPGGAGGKAPTCQRRRHKDLGSIPGLGRSPGGGHGNPLQYSCLENPMDRGAWQATVYRVTESQTRLSN